MPLRFVLVCAVAAAGFVAASPARALNPQHAGLQVALRAQGLYSGPIDAIVGPRTVAGIRAFQREQGLRITGKVDAKTRRAFGPLGRHLFGSRQLVRGEFGWDVAVLQFLLVRHGVKVPVNGYLDKPTLLGLRHFQRHAKLEADGIGGPRTFAVLRGKRVTVHLVQTAVRIVKTKTRLYVVKPGDSLTAIAHGAGVSLTKLAKLNHVDPARVLLIGKKLRVPVRVEAAAPAAAAKPQVVDLPATSNTAMVRASLDEWSAYYGIDQSLAHALAWMESGFNNALVSSVGAQGVMQLLPTTWDYVETVLIGHKVAHDADGNVHVGMAYLHHLLAAFNGDESLALAAWYQGEKSVRDGGPLEVSKIFVANVLALQKRM
jgi:LysM repeat protein